MKEIAVDNDFNYRLFYLGGFVERIQVTITFRYIFLVLARVPRCRETSFVLHEHILGWGKNQVG